MTCASQSVLFAAEYETQPTRHQPVMVFSRFCRGGFADITQGCKYCVAHGAAVTPLAFINVDAALVEPSIEYLDDKIRRKRMIGHPTAKYEAKRACLLARIAESND